MQRALCCKNTVISPRFKNAGNVAEWLGSALQKLLQRFESARYLKGCRIRQLFYLIMLTKDEQQFVDYWRLQRTKKRHAGFNIGFPLGVCIVLGIFISIVTGWHKQALAVLSSDYSTILVIVLAGLAIVVFLSVFAGRYQWEQREQRYTELLAKQKQAERDQA